MSTAIRITAGKVIMDATLNDSPTAQAVAQALPIKGKGNRWGLEIYFAIPVEADEEADAREVLQMGEIAYWPPGNAFCMFFGKTPASSGNEIRAASAVNVIGIMTGDLTKLSDVPNGAPILIELR
jgi:uncharacterized protein